MRLEIIIDRKHQIPTATMEALRQELLKQRAGSMGERRELDAGSRRRRGLIRGWLSICLSW